MWQKYVWCCWNCAHLNIWHSCQCEWGQFQNNVLTIHLNRLFHSLLFTFLFILKLWTALYFVLLPSWRWCWRRIRTKTGLRFKWRNSVSSTMEVLRSSVSSGLHHHYRRRRTAACDQRVTWQQQKKNMRLFIFVRWVKTLQTIMEFEMLDLKMFIQRTKSFWGSVLQQVLKQVARSLKNKFMGCALELGNGRVEQSKIELNWTYSESLLVKQNSN